MAAMHAAIFPRIRTNLLMRALDSRLHRVRKVRGVVAIREPQAPALALTPPGARGALR